MANGLKLTVTREGNPYNMKKVGIYPYGYGVTGGHQQLLVSLGKRGCGVPGKRMGTAQLPAPLVETSLKNREGAISSAEFSLNFNGKQCVASTISIVPQNNEYTRSAFRAEGEKLSAVRLIALYAGIKVLDAQFGGNLVSLSTSGHESGQTEKEMRFIGIKPGKPEPVATWLSALEKGIRGMLELMDNDATWGIRAI